MNLQDLRVTRGIRRRKAVIDLNIEPRDHERASTSAILIGNLQGETVHVPTMIDVDAIEDDVIESSASAFAEAKSKSSRARRRPLMVDVESGVTTRLHTNKRRHILSKQPFIDCDHVDVVEVSMSMVRDT